jgi:hypothetical protein
MWEALGGEIAWVGALGWLRVFRPFRVARARFVENRGGRAAKGLASPLAAALDALARRIGPPSLRTARPPTTARPLEPEAMVAELPRLTSSMRLHPQYEAGYLGWLFDELSRPRRRGTLVRRLVCQDDRVLGWYVYYLKPGGVSRVLQIMGSEKDIGAVVDHLFHDAEAGGAAALEGRLEPRLLASLGGRRCVIRYTAAAGLHSRNPELVAAACSRHSVFTRMDSEYWPIPPRPS